jgi:hypothetical protein
MELVKERISDRRVLKLIRQWLEAGVMEDGAVRETLAGTPQGGVISPLLANIYLNKLDRIWVARCSQLGILVRYADDLVAMCRSASAAREALRRIGLVMNRLGLTLHPVKTRLVDLRRGKESFVFLGCTIRKRRSIQRNPRWHFMQRWPSPKATKKLRDRVRELTSKGQSGKDVKQIIAKLNPVLRGWGNYFRTGNADREFNKMDAFVIYSLRRWQHRRGGQRPTRRPLFTWDQLRGMGLYRLMGTVKYPSQATPRKSSLSRVPENGTHGCVSSEGWRVQWGTNPTGAIVRSSVAWIAGRKETEFLKPIDKPSEGMAASHRAATKVNASVASKVLTQGPSPQP